MTTTISENSSPRPAEITAPAYIPPVFVSHGAPDLILADTDATRFLASYSKSNARPKAIVIVSAHFENREPAVVTDPAPGMIYDFGGFDPKLRTMVYPAPGAPQLAEKIAQSLEAAGHAAARIPARGYDHGAWVPLMLMFPDADIPVVQLSVSPGQSARWHYQMGTALAPLSADGVLVVGSGSITHNLSEIFRPTGRRNRNDAVPDWVSAFSNWIAERLAAGDTETLLAYRDRAPFAAENHPTGEHLLPLFVALGAAAGLGSNAVKGRRLHASNEFGVLAMDAYTMEPAVAA